ncbi:hypothetical protein Tsubulata_047730 [Turnera subulata]|uniref:Uncharacterized protein n=1 Tax=Turnera subulata TaxID=218843 RepID=A0A9Q0FNN6_9ROSI|nr:hypothetical protein Tsubulata_047730 [Turnera subulata]
MGRGAANNHQAMGFFDLNIPYEPPSKSSSSSTNNNSNTRLNLASKAMELGYSGVAYNRTIKTTLSDLDRCTIPLFSSDRLLSVSTSPASLASSVSFHRDLLSVPRSSPFRQYTRLTLAFDRANQATVLNGHNAVVKSYDLVAVLPLSQSAFDYACQTAEVHIISIDLAEKLPFRLSFSLVNAAMKRGVYFEILYSGFIADSNSRKGILNSYKMLLDMTGGKNLIISSAAPSVNEFRGPYDVANLLSLFGLSMERAKAAISKNCRNLITNVMRKKHFYKETIRIEPIQHGQKSDMNKSLALDLFNWDPISSGEGDLELDDLAQSFSVTTRTSKTVKAIDFASLVDSKHGNFLLAETRSNEVPVVSVEANEKPGGRDIFPGIEQTSSMDIDSNAACVADGKLDVSAENLLSQTSIIDSKLSAVSTADMKTDIWTENINIFPSTEKKPTSLQEDFLGDNSTVEDNPSVASYSSVKVVKEDQGHRDPNVEDNTPVQPGTLSSRTICQLEQTLFS